MEGRKNKVAEGEELWAPMWRVAAGPAAAAVRPASLRRARRKAGTPQMQQAEGIGVGPHLLQTTKQHEGAASAQYLHQGGGSVSVLVQGNSTLDQRNTCHNEAKTKTDEEHRRNC